MKDTFGSMALHLGEGSRVGCHTYPDGSASGPILFFSVPRVSLTVSPTGRGDAVTAEDVTRARALAEAVAVYLAEVERLAARNAESIEDGTPKPGDPVAAV